MTLIYPVFNAAKSAVGGEFLNSMRRSCFRILPESLRDVPVNGETTLLCLLEWLRTQVAYFSTGWPTDAVTPWNLRFRFQGHSVLRELASRSICPETFRLPSQAASASSSEVTGQKTLRSSRPNADERRLVLASPRSCVRELSAGDYMIRDRTKTPCTICWAWFASSVSR